MTRPDGDRDPRDDRGRLDPAERDLEAPAADAAEQSVPASPAEEAGTGTAPEAAGVQRGFEVGEWDALEQSIIIDMENDYDR